MCEPEGDGKGEKRETETRGLFNHLGVYHACWCHIGVGLGVDFGFFWVCKQKETKEKETKLSFSDLSF